MKYILLLAVAAASLVAADVTGKWTGTLNVPTADGGERPGPAYLVLHQDGTKVTGTAGPSAAEQDAIQNGKAEDGNVTFELSREGWLMKFVLRQDADELKGDVTRERDGQTETAKLTANREK